MLSVDQNFYCSLMNVPGEARGSIAHPIARGIVELIRTDAFFALGRFLFELFCLASFVSRGRD